VQAKAIVYTAAARETAFSTEGAARAARMFAMVVFTASGAQLAVRLPFTPVPLTMQTLFVVLSGVTLGARDGFYAMLSYVALGLAGAPVFAGFGGGPAVLLGPTGGYLALFPVAALVSGYLSTVLGGHRAAVFLASLCGMTLILAGGAFHLALVAGLSLPRAAALAIAPFALGEVAKALIAAAVSRRTADPASRPGAPRATMPHMP